jgi:membrane protein DedA with SNARE-associated domain
MMALESMLAPIPSEVVMPFAGYLVHQLQMNMPLVLLVALLGSIAGSLLSYALGLYGGRPIVERYGRWFLLGPKELAWTDAFFARWGALAVFAGRFIPVVRHVISIPAGTARMPLRKFLPPTAAGAFAWNAFLAYMGLQLGPSWDSLGSTIGPYEDALLALAIVGGLAFVAHRWRAGREVRPPEAAGEAADEHP